MNKTNMIEELKQKKELKLYHKWSVSRGQETYGYNISSLWIEYNRKLIKIVSCTGGGFDMIGDNLGDIINLLFIDDLQLIDNEKYYGIYYSKTQKKYKADGGCGRSSMKGIFKAMGYIVEENYKLEKLENFTITKAE